MYIGHVGLALAAAGSSRRVPPGWLVAAALLPDLLNVALLATGVGDRQWAISHGIPTVVVCAALLGALTACLVHNVRAALVVAALVLAHLPLDYVTSTELPLWAGGPMVGLRLYDHGAVDFLLETAMAWWGWTRYRHGAPASSRHAQGSTRPMQVMLGGLAALQALFWATNGP